MSINKETFMQIREQERISKLKRAVRFYYLNKSCFAGNWQTNSKGKFTTAFARWGRTLPLKKIQLINQFLNSINISFYSQDFETFLPQIKPDDLVYLDPPYFVNKNSSKNEYTKNWFDNKDQERLLNFCKQLPCKFFLSNSYSEQVVEFYKGFNVEIYDVARDLSKGKRKFQEILVSN
jgi:DNA adenine methylase